MKPTSIDPRAEAWARFSQHFCNSATSLLAAAQEFASIEAQGWFDGEISQSTAKMLRQLNKGELLPQVVLRIGFGRPQLIQKVSQLPPEEQNRLAESGKVSVVQKGVAGLQTIELAVEDLPPGVVRQVFNGNHIRTPEEQAELLAQRSGAKVRGRSEDADECRRPATQASAANMAPGDLAEAIMEMVARSSDPWLVAQKLLAELAKIKRPRLTAV